MRRFAEPRSIGVALRRALFKFGMSSTSGGYILKKGRDAGMDPQGSSEDGWQVQTLGGSWDTSTSELT